MNMKWNSSIIREGESGVSAYIPSDLKKNFDIGPGDEITIRILEEKEEGDEVDALLIVLDS